MRFILAPHVYACATGGQLVLLDIRRDRYEGMGAAQAFSLAPWVIGWPDLTSMVETQPPLLSSDRVRRLIERLETHGLITREPVVRQDIVPVVPRAETELVHEVPGIRPRVSMRDAGALLLASGRAAGLLRFTGLRFTVSHVRRRKQRALSGIASHSIQTPGDPLAEIVGSFISLRPLLFGARNHCLFDSLALVEYLAVRRIFPTWVFGVRVNPFAAHCWVQEGTVVFNDTPENVRCYTPILIV